MKCNVCDQEKKLPYYELRRWKICRECYNAKRRKYREDNRDKVREQKRRYYRENRKQKKESDRKYYLANREKILERNRQYQRSHRFSINENKVCYRKDNENHKELHRKYAHERRARKRNVESESWTHSEIAVKGSGVCPYCGKEIGLLYDSKIMHIDHIIPLSREGSDLKENLEPICCECNIKKGSKTKEEYLLCLTF
jgi:5-methylcytosine-specific restriction endonuclease McrA